MKKDRLHKKTPGTMELFGIAVFSLILLTWSVVPAIAVESISVSCYDADNFYIGNAVAYDITTVADVCNNLYFACKDECSGCFQDFDYVEDVCISPGGRAYLRY